MKSSVAWGENYWCQKCESYHYPNQKKKKRWRTEPDIIPIDTIKMKKQIDDYEQKFHLENRAKITEYSSETHSQEFLKSLIPKK